MGIVIIAAAVAGVAGAAVTFVVLSQRTRATDQSLQTAQVEARDLTQRLAVVEAERAAVASERDELARDRDRLATERDRAQEALADEIRRREAAEVSAAAAQADAAAGAAGRAGSASQPGPSGPVPQPHQEADGCWALLLADVERRWAAVAGVPPELRGVHLGAVPDQLAEALTREVERLREEVGVDISFAPGASVEPSDPVVFLLAATHLLGVLAAGCQQVKVKLDGALEVSGEGWAGSHDELEQVRERALAAGAEVDPLDIVVTERPADDDPESTKEHVLVSVALRHGPGSG